MTGCACSVLSGRQIRVAPRDSREERRAEAMADAAMTGRPVTQGAGGRADTVYRACAACAADGKPCADCEEEALHLSRDGTGRDGSSADCAAAAIAGGGSPLSGPLRQYFEPRFGADLGAVRVHRDAAAGAAAQSIGARAYAHGAHIGFAPGAWAPETQDGRHLIAHELAHTLGADGQLHRAPATDDETAPRPPRDMVRPVPNVHSESFEDDAGGGGTSFEEILETEPIRAGHHVQGKVRRREIAPRTATEDREVIADHKALVDFNTDTCEVRLPFRFGFRRSAGDPNNHNCQGDPMSGRPDVDAIAARYIAAVNSSLNDQFKVRLTGCDNDCAGRDIPIRVSVSRDDTDADKSIEVVPRSGRGSARYLCAGNFEEGFAAHEAGHQVLGRGDEYPETDPKSLEAHRNRRRTERVRRDNNRMGERRRWGRFGMFHERDFRHVTTFLNHIFPGCTAELVPIRPVIPEFRPFLRAGLGSLDGALSGQLGGGLDVGLPVTRDRRWLALVGAEASYLASLDLDKRRLVLAGMRLGFERQVHTAGPTLRLSGIGQFGVSHEFARSESAGFGADIDHPDRTGAYAGGELGFGIQPGAGLSVDLRLGAGGELGNDPRAAHWINVGLALGGRF